MLAVDSRLRRRGRPRERVVRILILGPLEIRKDGELIDIPAGKPRALLAIRLLRAGAVVSSDRLVEELGGERPPLTATKNVQVYIARLRKLLGEGMLATKAPGYALWIDELQLDS